MQLYNVITYWSSNKWVNYTKEEESPLTEQYGSLLHFKLMKSVRIRMKELKEIWSPLYKCAKVSFRNSLKFAIGKLIQFLKWNMDLRKLLLWTTTYRSY